MSTVPLSILSEIINSAYLKLIPFFPRLAFWFVSPVLLNIISKVISSEYLALNPLILVSEGV